MWAWMAAIWSAVICCPGTGIGIDMMAAGGMDEARDGAYYSDGLQGKTESGYVARVGVQW
jgi:hypothetical protein